MTRHRIAAVICVVTFCGSCSADGDRRTGGTDANNHSNNGSPVCSSTDGIEQCDEDPPPVERRDLGLILQIDGAGTASSREGAGVVTEVIEDWLSFDDGGAVVEFAWEGDDLQHYFEVGDEVEFAYSRYETPELRSVIESTIATPTATAEVLDTGVWGDELGPTLGETFQRSRVAVSVGSTSSASTCLVELSSGLQVRTRSSPALLFSLGADEVELEQGAGALLGEGWAHNVRAHVESHVPVEATECIAEDEGYATATYISRL